VEPIAVDVRGSGLPLVYVHDEYGPQWSPFLETLAAGFEVHAVTLPGFAEAPRPDNVDSVDDIAFAMADLLEALPGQPAALVGASLGGWVALEAAIRAHPVIAKLVLIGSPGVETDDYAPADYFSLPQDDRDALLFNDLNAIPELQLDHAVRNGAMTARLVWQPRYLSPKLAGRLHRVRVPSLVVWGADDRFLPASYGADLATRLGAANHVVAGAGHFPHYERPEETARVTNEFLSGSSRTERS
jgi:pimeloyl-ACP methyl ester carboxylesterase